MIVYAVAYKVGGYAREDADSAKIGGIYTDINRALIHAKVVGGDAITIEIDVMPPGIEAAAKELGLLKQ